MGGSTADTPTTPEFLRVSDADRDHAVNELRDEFVEGRLSHETFVYRMQTALAARNRGQLAKLFTDLPPRRARPAELLARIKAVLRGDGRGSPDMRTYRDQPATEARRPEALRSEALRSEARRPERVPEPARTGLVSRRRRFPSRRAAAGASPSGGLATATCACPTCRCPGCTLSWSATMKAGCSATWDLTTAPG